MRIGPHSFPPVSCFLLQPFKYCILWSIFPIPPAPTLPYEFLIQVHPIGQDHLAKCAPVLVLAVGLDGDFLAIN
jgi:hypothetical protein